jgi:high-affinity nickel-transport protein
MGDGQRPLGVGFFFSLGHSSIVFLLAVGFTIGIRGLGGAVANDGSWLHSATGLVGPTVSGTFLFVIGLLNLIVLISIVGIFQRMRAGDYSEAELERELDRRGFMNRFYSRATNAVTASWQMYPLGFLFGLGFDTATEVALLATAGAAAAGGLPFYAILCLPVLFAAGMSLMDTIDGMFMNFAYGWAFSQPVRKIFYNITITSLSVLVALLIGTIELVSVLSQGLNLSGQPWDFVAGLDINHVGYAIVVSFAVAWLIALAVWRFGRVEQKWSAGIRS